MRRLSLRWVSEEDSNPCCFHHREKNISVVVHGDNFTALGGKIELEWYEAGLKDALEIKIKCHLGERA